jgi:hypothetical protein
MFERYIERARKAIFFARYEASVFGSPSINPEHLLLGLLRESRALKISLGEAGLDAVRAYIEQHTPRSGESVSTSVDLPVSLACLRALTAAAEAADELGYKNIEDYHLVLGLLRQGDGIAVEALGRQGITYEGFRDKLVKHLEKKEPKSFLLGQVNEEPEQQDNGTPWVGPAVERVAFALQTGFGMRWIRPAQPPEPAAPSVAAALQELAALIGASIAALGAYSEADMVRPIKHNNWSRKEALGHLIDWASVHHSWFARALTEPEVKAAGYPGEAWVAAQRYRECDWRDLAELWVSQNSLLAHVIAQIPEERLAVPCRIGLDKSISLSELIANYIDHCQTWVARILKRD